VSQQEADEKRLALAAREADVESAKATIKAQEANVKRLEELQSFKQILAPFDGVVTARNVEVGTLVPRAAAPGRASSSAWSSSSRSASTSRSRGLRASIKAGWRRA
jgi:multidrug efflux pump subunit AcrA (membrane-fusion protein)